MDGRLKEKEVMQGAAMASAEQTMRRSRVGRFEREL